MLRRSRFAGVLSVIITAVIVLASLGLVLTVTFAVVGSESRIALPVSIEPDAVVVEGHSRAEWIPFVVYFLVLGSAFIYALAQLRAFVRSAGAGDPFTRSNVRRLRIMGLFILLLEPVGRPLYGVATAPLLDDVDAPLRSPFAVDVGSVLPWVVVALIVFVLAEVFAHGVRLREDVEATV